MALQSEMTSGTLFSRLEHLMRAQLHLCENLLASIRRETDLLKSHEHEIYIEELPAKHQLLAALKALEVDQGVLLQEFGHDSLSASVAACPSSAHTLLPLQAELRELTQSCADENRLLGQLIHGQSRFFNFLLGNLLPGRQENLTYQQNGSRPPGIGVGKLISV